MLTGMVIQGDNVALRDPRLLSGFPGGCCLFEAVKELDDLDSKMDAFFPSHAFSKAETMISREECQILNKNRSNRAGIAANLGIYKEAEAIYLDLKRKAPNDLINYYNMACLHSQWDKLDKSKLLNYHVDRLSMCLRTFPWLTITHRCWSGALRLFTAEVLIDYIKTLCYYIYREKLASRRRSVSG